MEMEVKVFGKSDCEFCKTTVKKFETFAKRWNVAEAFALNFINMDTVDGLAEGAFYSVTKIPTTVIEVKKNIVERWDGKVPLSEEFKKLFEEMIPTSPKDIN